MRSVIAMPFDAFGVDNVPSVITLTLFTGFNGQGGSAGSGTLDLISRVPAANEIPGISPAG